MSAAEKKPVLLLDIDGVLLIHADSKSGFEACPYGYREYPTNPYMFYNPSLAEPLSDLLQSMEGFYVSAHFAQSDADVRRALPLPSLPWISPIKMHQARRSEIDPLDMHFPDRPVVWIDDAFQNEVFVRASERTARGVDTLLINTDPNKGIEETHIGEIHEWLGRLSLEV